MLSTLRKWKKPRVKVEREEPTLVTEIEESTRVQGVEFANSQPGHDAARLLRSEDYLDRWPVAQSMYRAIKTAPAGFSTRIGLYGEWGAGKTSVLNFLHNIAMANEDVVVHVSAGRAADVDSFISTLCNKMSVEIKRMGLKPYGPAERRRKLAAVSSSAAAVTSATGQVVGKMDGDIATTISMGAAFVATVATTMMDRLKLTLEELEGLREVLAKRGARVIVFIDDLDRADPAILPSTLMTLRDYLDWPDFAFVLAFDKDIITCSLKEYSTAFSSSRQPFLDKIVDLAFELEPLSAHQCKHLSERALAECCDFIPEQARTNTAQWFPDNPRKVRAIARELGCLRDVAVRHGDGELKWEAIILQTLLRREVPACAKIVEQRLLGKGKMALALSLGPDSKTEASALHQAVFEASGYGLESAALHRLRQLIEKLQGLRNFQESEQIDYEMSLVTHVPCFTQRELMDVITQWSMSHRDALPDEALRAAAFRGQTTLDICASRFLNMTLDQYAICNRELKGQTFKAQHNKTQEHALAIIHFLEKLVAPQRGAALVNAASSLQICSRMLDLFTTHSSVADSKLRSAELRILECVAQRCVDRAQLYYQCVRYRSEAPLPQLVQSVSDITVGAAVDEALALFTTASGMSLCRMQSAPNPLLEIVRRHDSALYTVENKERLRQLLLGDEGEERRSVMAWNCMEYLRILIDRSNDFSLFCTHHRPMLEACWSAVIGEEWVSSGEEQVMSLHHRLCPWIGESLPLPHWAKASQPTTA
ncbi:KAP family P-loop NTPase fold protein [Pseudomonas fluorescens]